MKCCSGTCLQKRACACGHVNCARGHVHMAHIWFEHRHVKEGPRDAGKKTDWDFEVGGPSYCENKNG